MSLLDDVKKNLVEWYTATSELTAEVARVTSRRYDKFGISRDIERQFSELGSLIYTGLKDGRSDLLDGEAVRTLVARLDHLEAELRAKDEEIERIKREHRARKASPTAGVGGDDPDPDVEDATRAHGDRADVRAAGGIADETLEEDTR